MIQRLKKVIFVYDSKDKVIRFVKRYLKDEWIKKITHSNQPLDKDIHGFGYWTKDIIPLSLSEVEEAINGYSAGKMAYDWLYENEENIPKGYPLKPMEYGYIEGFKAHQELTKDKLFTIEDMRKAINMVRKNWNDEIVNEDKIIQSFQSKTEWDIEFDEQGKIKLK